MLRHTYFEMGLNFMGGMIRCDIYC